MAIQHTWKITQMDTWVESNLVFYVHFAIETIDTDNPTYNMTQNHAVSIPYNPSGTTIPYENLTEEQVIDWVKTELKIYQTDENGVFVLDVDGNRIEIGDQVPDLLASGEAQLQDLIHPKSHTLPLPWVN